MSELEKSAHDATHSITFELRAGDPVDHVRHAKVHLGIELRFELVLCYWWMNVEIRLGVGVGLSVVLVWCWCQD